MTKEEHKEKLDESMEQYSNECKQISLWGFGIVSAFAFNATLFVNTDISWLLLVAIIFAIALLSRLLRYYEKACFWYNLYKRENSNGDKHILLRNDEWKQIKREWRCLSLSIFYNLIGFFLLCILVAAKTNMPYQIFRQVEFALWVIVAIGIFGLSCFHYVCKKHQGMVL